MSTVISTTVAADIAAIVERIQGLNRRHGGNKLQLIRDSIEIGQELKKLKQAAGHGQWARVRSEAGFGETQAVRLMKLADKRWLADEILSGAQDLNRLPTDVQKLIKLVELDRDRVLELIALQDFDDMNRKQVRETVEAKQMTDQGLSVAKGGARATPPDMVMATIDEPETVMPESTTAAKKGPEHKAVTRTMAQSAKSDPPEDAVLITQLMEYCLGAQETTGKLLAAKAMLSLQLANSQLLQVIDDTCHRLAAMKGAVEEATAENSTGGVA